MRKEKLPRGIHRRGSSLVISFAYQKIVRYVSLGNCSVEFARDQLAITKMEIRKGTWKPKAGAAQIPEPAPVAKVEDLWTPYVTNYCNRGGKDKGRQTIAWHHLAPKFGKLLVSQVSTAAIDEYVASRQAEGVKGATVNRELSILQAMFRLGARSTENGKPVVDRLPAFPGKLKEGPPKKGFIKDQEYSVLMSQAKEPWLLAFIEAAFSFGFRKSELLNLRCGQVDLLDRRITLYETKNGRSRTVMMTGGVYERFRVLMRGKGKDDFVLTRKDGSRVVDPRQEWYDLCVASKLGEYVLAKRANGESYKKYSGLTPHDFRRSAVKAMKLRGVPDRVVMEIGGWRTRAVFDRYFPVDEQELADAAQRIEDGRKPQVVAVAPDQTQTKLKHANVPVS